MSELEGFFMFNLAMFVMLCAGIYRAIKDLERYNRRK